MLLDIPYRISGKPEGYQDLFLFCNLSLAVGRASLLQRTPLSQHSGGSCPQPIPQGFALLL
ncbi:hypothetical protein PCASD_21986 [Puccinia coronata f. sp. avenae]|uniref:Uncharacterized protein n=1 Tax=Puccinia coronata f. sp. avenae TaxID=200324 RepID=A0A2N5U396_9BASI|nr:hypothetical protein PCASD_21986 [Puccinia coronata f. sp. avenae]